MMTPHQNPFGEFPPVARDWKTWDGQQPVMKGERCFAISLWRPPKWWRPRIIAAVPPLWKAVLILSQSRSLDAITRDINEFNARQIQSLTRGKRIKLWSVAVTMENGYDETAKVLEGGRRNG